MIIYYSTGTSVFYYGTLQWAPTRTQTDPEPPLNLEQEVAVPTAFIFG